MDDYYLSWIIAFNGLIRWFIRTNIDKKIRDNVAYATRVNLVGIDVLSRGTHTDDGIKTWRIEYSEVNIR